MSICGFFYTCIADNSCKLAFMHDYAMHYYDILVYSDSDTDIDTLRNACMHILCYHTYVIIAYLVMD